MNILDTIVEQKKKEGDEDRGALHAWGEEGTRSTFPLRHIGHSELLLRILRMPGLDRACLLELVQLLSTTLGTLK